MNPPRSSTVRRYLYSGSSSSVGGEDETRARAAAAAAAPEHPSVGDVDDDVVGADAAAGFLIRVAKRSHPSGFLARVGGGSSGGGGGGGRDGFAR